MNSEQVIAIYETVSDLTGQMLEAARSRDWESLVALEHQCADQVAVLKDSETVVALSGPSRARKVEIIHQILAHDRAIREISEPWMAELAALLNNSSTARKLNAAYGV